MSISQVIVPPPLFCADTSSEVNSPRRTLNVFFHGMRAPSPRFIPHPRGFRRVPRLPVPPNRLGAGRGAVFGLAFVFPPAGREAPPDRARFGSAVLSTGAQPV